MKRAATIAILAGFFLALGAAAAEISFIEDFALAPDRAKPLSQLIAGTEDYYYYHCLHYQNTGQFDKVEELLKTWIERHQRTPRVLEIQNRQALLTYDKDPAAALKLLTERLNLQFNHQRRVLGEKPALPTALDGAAISRDTLTKAAMARYQNLDGFNDSALESLAAAALEGDRRRDLLRRLRRPDVPNLVPLVIADLDYKNSGGFGSHGIHRLMTLSQLDELLKLRPDLLNQSNFVMPYLSKLAPTADEDLRTDLKAKAAHLERLWGFVSKLAPVYNSLKAHVLYHRLAFDRSQGTYDRERFDTYVKLPRRAFYMNPKYLETDQARRYPVDLAADFHGVTGLPVIGSDEPLVRDYLMHFFLDAEDYKAFQDYVIDTYLKEVFAETKLVNGVGDQEKWYSLLLPEKVQALKDRVDIDFAPANKRLFAPDDAVKLDVDVKNVPVLTVKVFEINLPNYYRDNLRELDTDINLDGLVANQEKRVEYKDAPPLRRVRRTFTSDDFPALKGRGAYVVEFIGNGRSSRALVFKGRLYFLQRRSVAGQILTVMDESNHSVDGAKVWMAGQEYAADKDGRVTIPYTAQPGGQKLVLISGHFASLAELPHQAEAYALRAGFHVEREALLKGRKAKVAIRTTLTCGDDPAPQAVLEEVALVLASTDHEGIVTTKEVADFKLADNGESTYEFQVPERLSAITFTLKAKVKNLSKNAKEDLAASQTFVLNQIDKTEKVEDLFRSKTEGGYVVDLLGRNGEPRPDRAVHFQFHHRDFRDPVHVSLKTDAKGRITLGGLKDIVGFIAASPEGTVHQWALPQDGRVYPASVSAKSGVAVSIPYMGSAKEPAREEFSLLEVRGGTFSRDGFGNIKLKDGFLVLEGLPAGDYDLLIKPDKTTIRIHLADGPAVEGYVHSGARHLELSDPAPLQVVSAAADKDKLTIRLANVGKDVRVHVAATRYMPQYPVFQDLQAGIPDGWMVPAYTPLALYISGRDIGDEYRYILDRQYAQKFPGNMLSRPGLLLNPWAVSKTESAQQQAGTGGGYGRGGAGGANAMMKRALPASLAQARVDETLMKGLPNLDFLAEGAVLLTNLKPDDKGVLTIDRKELGGHQNIHILAVDPENTVYRQLALAEAELKTVDLRLPASLDVKKHFSEQKQVTVLDKGDKLTVADPATAKVEVYDDLASVHRLYVTLSGNADLVEFSFITTWPKLAPEKKRELYSKYACHELNFFLSRKDAAFFEAVIKPYLKNKKDKTFMDRYLLGEDLAEFLKPWAYAQLNVAEQVLLGRRVANERGSIARDVKDALDLIPPDIDRWNLLFFTALKGKALESSSADAALFRATTVTEFANGAVSYSNVPRGEEGRATLSRTGLDGQRLALAAAKPAPAPESPALQEESLRSLEKAKSGKVADRAEQFEKDKIAGDMVRRQDAQKRQLYQRLDKTEEWAENNYYHLPIHDQNAGLVGASAFWNDYAAFDEAARKPFLSKNVAEASHNFSEMMLALAVLDLPFEPAKHDVAEKDGARTLTAGGPAIVFHKEVKEAPGEASKNVFVSQDFYRHGERFIQVGNEKVDHFVTDEFLTGVVYGCQVVITNATSSKQKIEALLQVPRGAIPVLGGQYTRSVRMDLEPYRTATLDYFFYFPRGGEYAHYPLQVAKEGQLLASAQAVTLKAVDIPSKVDTQSWEFISQNGKPEEVLAFLNANNLGRVDLEEIAWRMADKDFFAKTIALLTSRKVYEHTLWSYGIKHNEPAVIREYLRHCDDFLSACGDYIDCKILTLDPVLRKTYQHLEYAPLVNARAHPLGKRRQIVNDRLAAQYHALLGILSYRKQLDDEDLLAVTYYLLLQDRVEEGKAFLARVEAKKLAERIQYDYFTAYVDFYSDEPKAAREIAMKYKDYGVDRWRKLFAEVLNQLDQIEGKAPAVIDTENREQRQAELAARSPSLDLKVEDRKVTLTFQNLDEVTVNYYRMDVELLFSQSPFMQHETGRFSFIKPNATATVALAKDAKAAPGAPQTQTFDLPKDFHDDNVLVEVIGGGLKRSQAYYAHSLALELVENYGQVRVSDEKGKPLAKVYVKVYARMKDGSVKFYKDGYTDLRGRFEYTSLSTDELDRVDKFALLILSQSKGAVVREASPPKR